VGIESDHLVYEYLSRVGDLAQRRQLSSGDRMRLVSGLRDEIDRRRAKYDPDTPAAVRRILERIGTPEEVLDTLGELTGPTAAVPVPPPAVPVQRSGGSGGRWRKPSPPPEPEQRQNVPPHLAGLDELGPGDGVDPDWWALSPGGGTGAGPQVEGFAGGIEIPDLFKKPEEDEPPSPQPETGGPSSARRLVRFLRERRERKTEAAAPEEAAAAPRRIRMHPFLLLAAVLLLVGVLSGYWLLLGAGWLLAYASRVLGPAERKWALLGLPVAVFAAGMLWVWGRAAGNWGEPLPREQLGTAFRAMWPALARTAGVVTAAYLTWRARRRG
jgi:hypothetical protein